MHALGVPLLPFSRHLRPGITGRSRLSPLSCAQLAEGKCLQTSVSRCFSLSVLIADDRLGVVRVACSIGRMMFVLESNPSPFSLLTKLLKAKHPHIDRPSGSSRKGLLIAEGEEQACGGRKGKQRPQMDRRRKTWCSHSSSCLSLCLILVRDHRLYNLSASFSPTQSSIFEQAKELFPDLVWEQEFLHLLPLPHPKSERHSNPCSCHVLSYHRANLFLPAVSY